MKLIDLLVQELPKRGGWPEGVTHIGQDYDHELMFYGRGRAMTGIFLDELAIDHRKHGVSGAGSSSKITQEQYESALVASQKPAWNGEGLPPVGCECEVKRAFDWVKCKILFISDTHVALMADEECCWNTYACQFRPLRTEAERKRDEAIEAILSDMRTIPCDLCLRDEVAVIYDAIAAGKIPGLKLED